MAITRLHVQGYRCLRDVDLELRPLTVLIGPNASGKSSVLDVLMFLRQALDFHLHEAAGERGGLAQLQTYGAQEAMSIALAAEHGGRACKYAFALEKSGSWYNITSERLETECDGTYDFQPERAEAWRRMEAAAEHLPPEVDLPWEEFPSVGELLVPSYVDPPLVDRYLRFLKGTELYRALDVSPNSPARSQQTIRPTLFPRGDGGDLFAALHTIRSTQEALYERIEDSLRAGFPGFRKLEFPSLASGQVSLAWHEQDVGEPLWPNQLSDGTLRYLWLCAILLSPQPPPVVLIDEPEVSLHPTLLMLLSELLRDAATRTQVIVATQSPELVRWLEPEEVIVLDKEEGRVTARRGDSFDLGEWLEEYTLADAWLTGLMGGRP